MLSDRSYHFLEVVWPKLVQIGVCTYTWDPSLKIFVKPQKKNSKLLILNLFICAIWITFQVVQLVRFSKKEEKTGFGILFSITISFLVCVISYTLTIMFGEEWFQTINAIMIFLRKMNSKFCILKTKFKLYLLIIQ